MQNILDLKSQGKTVRDIAAILGLSKSAAGRILKKAETLPTPSRNTPGAAPATPVPSAADPTASPAT